MCLQFNPTNAHSIETALESKILTAAGGNVALHLTYPPEPNLKIKPLLAC